MDTTKKWQLEIQFLLFKINPACSPANMSRQSSASNANAANAVSANEELMLPDMAVSQTRRFLRKT